MLTIDQINSIFAKYKQIDQVIVYGSRAKGNYKKGSDIDLVIKGRDLNLSMQYSKLFLLLVLVASAVVFGYQLNNRESSSNPQGTDRYDTLENQSVHFRTEYSPKKILPPTKVAIDTNKEPCYVRTIRTVGKSWAGGGLFSAAESAALDAQIQHSAFSGNPGSGSGHGRQEKGGKPPLGIDPQMGHGYRDGLQADQCQGGEHIYQAHVQVGGKEEALSDTRQLLL